MHARIVLNIRAVDRLAINHLHVEHILARSIRNPGDHPIMKDAQVNLAGYGWISPPLGEFAHRGIVIDVAAQDEAAWADSRPAADSDLSNRERTDRTVRVMSYVEHGPGWN